MLTEHAFFTFDLSFVPGLSAFELLMEGSQENGMPPLNLPVLTNAAAALLFSF